MTASKQLDKLFAATWAHLRPAIVAGAKRGGTKRPKDGAVTAWFTFDMDTVRRLQYRAIEAELPGLWKLAFQLGYDVGMPLKRGMLSHAWRVNHKAEIEFFMMWREHFAYGPPWKYDSRKRPESL